MRELAAARPQAFTTFCTKLRAAPLAPQVERELGIPLLDPVSTAVWRMLRAAGADPARIRGWGRLFDRS
jgi:maleate isomerase